MKADGVTTFTSSYSSTVVGDAFNGVSYTLAQLDQDGGFSGHTCHETFILNTLGGRDYYHYVYNRPGRNMNGDITVTVSILQSDGTYRTVATYTPNSTNTYWNVFAYKDGRIVQRNTYTSSPATDY